MLGFRKVLRWAWCWLVLAIAVSWTPIYAQDTTGTSQDSDDWGSLEGQQTWIWQRKPEVSAARLGPAYRLRADGETSFSASIGLTLRLNLLPHWQLIASPEVAAGRAISDLTGLGGFTNAELSRVSGPDPKPYWARTVLVYQGPKTEAGQAEVMVGYFPLLDLFDPNAYAHDGRTQFMNWSLLTFGAWDYPANARGISRGLAMSWQGSDYAIRLGRFQMPTVSNGPLLDGRLGQHHGDVLEVQKSWQIQARPGVVRALWYRNRAEMARYDEAMRWGERYGQVPNLAAVRRLQSQFGWGLSLEQRLSSVHGVFARYSQNRGQIETYAFTEIDASLAMGLEVQGLAWGRPEQVLGVAAVQNRLSGAHQQFLARGGSGFFLGDGYLNPAREQVTEIYWKIPFTHGLDSRRRGGPALMHGLTLGWQRIANPGYNRDRGPMQVWSLRWHSEI